MKRQIITSLILIMACTSLACAKSIKKARPASKKSGGKMQSSETIDWTEAPSLKGAFVDSGIFENIGFAVPAGRLGDSTIQAGVKHHATSITLENETKPDTFLRNISRGAGTLVSWTSSKGLTIQVPPQDKINFDTLDQAMKNVLSMGLRMRGHVLVWHSQTPKAFFCKDFLPSNPYVSIDEMDARQEWYIQSVLNHVTEWERANNGGKHLIYAWDVVNEAISDGPNGNDRLRAQSDWFSIYKNEDFIVNAFRYANKYAPKDVLLAYNDYNEFDGAKHQAILWLLDKIIAAKDDSELPTRIDLMGMQSHNQTGWPSLENYETAIKNFLARGLDIHVTELDITGKWLYGNTCEKPDLQDQKKTYAAYFELYKKYAKADDATAATDKHSITGVTFWGINDETSWRSGATPLLFAGYKTKPAFWGVLGK